MYNYIAPCIIVYSKSGHLVYCVLYVLIIRNTYQYVLRIVQPCLDGLLISRWLSDDKRASLDYLQSTRTLERQIIAAPFMFMVHIMGAVHWRCLLRLLKTFAS